MRKHFVKEYENTPAINKKGKITTEVVYKGDYYCNDNINKKQQLRYYILLFSVMILAFLMNGILESESSKIIYIALPYMCCFLPFAYIIMGIYRLWKNPDKMEKIQKERSYDRLLRSSVGILVLSILSIIGSVIYLINNSKDISILIEGRFLLLNGIISCIAFFLIKYTGKNIKLLTIKKQKNISNNV